MKAREWAFKKGCFGGGFTIYPYQLSLGFSLRYWPCIFAPAFRIHFLCFKLWGYITLNKRRNNETEQKNQTGSGNGQSGAETRSQTNPTKEVGEEGSQNRVILTSKGREGGA